MWLSSYYHPKYKRGPLVGNAVLTDIQSAVGRIEAHMRYFNGKDAQKKMYLHKIQGLSPPSSNTKYFLVNKR